MPSKVFDFEQNQKRGPPSFFCCFFEKLKLPWSPRQTRFMNKHKAQPDQLVMSLEYCFLKKRRTDKIDKIDKTDKI